MVCIRMRDNDGFYTKRGFLETDESRLIRNA